jgi:hypothetical protein
MVTAKALRLLESDRRRGLRGPVQCLWRSLFAGYRPKTNGCRHMKGLFKFGVVLAGYIAAVLTAGVAVYVRQLHTQGPDADASAGMYAFGDGVLFIEVLTVVAFLPTVLALYFLRPYRLFWSALSVTALALAATGFFAASVYVMSSSGRLAGSVWDMLAAFSVLRMLGAPLLAAAFVTSGLIAPARWPRWGLIIAGGIEGAVAAFAILHWFVHLGGTQA